VLRLKVSGGGGAALAKFSVWDGGTAGQWDSLGKTVGIKFQTILDDLSSNIC